MQGEIHAFQGGAWGSWMFPISERLVCKTKKKKNAPLSIYSLGFSPIVPMENGRFVKPGLGQTHMTKHISTKRRRVLRRIQMGAATLRGSVAAFRRLAAAHLAARGTCRCEKRHVFFLSAFPMFVPSLSWQNDRFFNKWHLKNAVFRRGFSRSWTPDVNGFTMRCEHKQTPFFGVLFSHFSCVNWQSCLCDHLPRQAWDKQM
jgi:hypothetical protein